MAIAVLAVAAVVTCKAVSGQNDTFFDMNLEALAQGEIGAEGGCEESRDLCIYCCTCGAKWEAKGVHHGPATWVRGQCTCGASINL